jgi:hypothetical protein
VETSRAAPGARRPHRPSAPRPSTPARDGSRGRAQTRSPPLSISTLARSGSLTVTSPLGVAILPRARDGRQAQRPGPRALPPAIPHHLGAGLRAAQRRRVAPPPSPLSLRRGRPSQGRGQRGSPTGSSQCRCLGARAGARAVPDPAAASAPRPLRRVTEPRDSAVPATRRRGAISRAIYSGARGWFRRSARSCFLGGAAPGARLQLARFRRWSLFRRRGL